MPTYLIDGHNLIGSNQIPGISIHQEDDEYRLVMWLRGRQPRLRAPMVVVFDGGIPGGTSRALSGGGVTAVFAAQYQTDADAVILRRVEKARSRGDMVVVTNDAALRDRAARLGAQVMRAEAFLSRLAASTHSSGSPAAEESEEPVFKEKPSMSQAELEEFLRLFGEEDQA